MRLRRLAVVAGAMALLVGTPVVAHAAPGQSDNLARSATATASYTSPWESVAAINDGIDPSTSGDTVNRRWGTWPNTGEQWALLTWPGTQTLRSADVYFFDDNGGVRVPASWRLQYWTGSAYADVPGASGYPTAANQYNAVNFTQVSTSRLRVVLQSGAASVGLLEVRAYASAIGTGNPGNPSGWNPPASLVQPLSEVWTHQEQTYNNLYGFRNSAWDQIFANGGTGINYCVRWDSGASVSAALRDRIQATLQRQFKKWIDVMAGHNGWPYQQVPVKVVGWAELPLWLKKRPHGSPHWGAFSRMLLT
ncbi:hypothetical protein ACQP1P_23740 [Dactylosporangium sp. CA-052675]|uniref:hypothetical protein n=1 Tax=Dactylosporangium sp. CA-052675 TaxID=3239927 RepID=UPI003D90AB8F